MKALVCALMALLSLQSFGQTVWRKPLRHFLQATPSASNAIPYGNNSSAGKYVLAKDANIYYEVYGKGKPIVVLHGGIFGSIIELGALIHTLAKQYQVIAVSTRGHGKSEIGSEPLTYEQKANDVYAVIKATTKDSVVIIGFSDGGYTGFKLASMYPQLVRKMVAIGAAELQPGMRNFNFDAEQVISYDTAYWRQQLALMPEPKRLQEWFTKMSDFYNHLVVDKALLQTVKCPVLVMAGDRDVSNPVQRVLNTANMLSKSQISIVPNCTHPVFLENFAAVWASIVPFLQ